MNIVKKFSLSFLFLFSFATATIRLNVIKHNDLVLFPEPHLFLALKETRTVEFKDISVEATLENENSIFFTLNYKNEEGKFVPFYTSGLVMVKNGDEVGFISADNGFSLIIRVTEI